MENEIFTGTAPKLVITKENSNDRKALEAAKAKRLRKNQKRLSIRDQATRK